MMIERMFIWLVCAALGLFPAFASAQSPISAFPPGTFQNRVVLGPAPVGYQGPGDVVSGATVWGSCARAYNASYANGTNSLCDLKDKTTGTVAICTLRILTTGFVDLAAPYCAGSTTPSVACAAAAGGSCVVNKIYDQTGNGRFWSTATLTAMPSLTFSALSGLPGLTCSASCVMPTATTITQAIPFSMAFVYERTGVFTTAQNVLSTSGGTLRAGPGSSASTLIISNPSGPATLTSVADSAFHAAQIVVGNPNSTVAADGASASAGAGTTGIGGVVVNLMSANGSSVGLTGVVMEVGIWPVDFTANITTLNTNAHGTSGYNF